MEHIEKQFEAIKDRVFHGDKNSTWPAAVKFELTPETKSKIEGFDKELSLSNRKLTTRMNYMKCLRNFFFFLAAEKKLKVIGLEKLAKEDLLDFFHHINSGRMSAGSVNIHKHVIRLVFKHMAGEDELPKIVRWIKFEKRQKPHLPKNLITEEQINEMIKYVATPRDKAIIACLAECGGRVSELLNVNIDDLEWLFEEETKVPIVRMRLVDCKGNTGERRIELYDAIPYLQGWLNGHPDKDNPNAPLFISMGNGNFGERMGRNMVWRILDTAGRKAGLENTTLNPHSFRHRALTEKGKFMSKFELAKFGGHTMSSKMVDVYIHLEDEDVINKQRQARGLAPIKKIERVKSMLNVKRCACGEVNPGTGVFCGRCRAPLDEKFVKMSREKLKEDIEKDMEEHDFIRGLMALVKRDPELGRRLKEAAEKGVSN